MVFSLPGYAIGDAWFSVNNGVAHFFCMSPLPKADWHWNIDHTVRCHLVHWEYVGLDLERGAGESWDSQTLSRWTPAPPGLRSRRYAGSAGGFSALLYLD